ncbi:MAG: sulfatase-like hydrolase/transferase, partial [Akkermansiaceae bacterium]|nr:sulfatase-like hydrolase/transferase [Akkermansiaceae bacterium]
KGSPTYKGKAGYFGDMVKYMDKLIGKILRKLDETGVRENTLVVFLGDNGTDTPVVSMMNGRKVAGAKGTMH